MTVKCIPWTFAAFLMSACLVAGAQTGGDPGYSKLFNAGQAAMAAGKYDEARADFERLETMDASVGEVHATLGVLDFKMGSFDRAVEEIRAARKLKPSLPGLDALLAMALAETGRNREALAGLEKAFHSAAEPQVRRQAGLELTAVYTRLRMDRKAAETALELRDLYKDDPEVLYNVGKILGNSAYLTMLDLFHSAGGSEWAQLAEAEAHESQGQFAEAIASYRGVLALDPHRVNVHYRMGRTYLKEWESTHAAADLTSAEDEFAREIEGNPANANAAYELAGLFWKEGKTKEARQLYESAIRSYPDFEEAEVGLGGVLLDEQEPALAAQHLKRAVQLRADDQVAWYRLAQAERGVGDAPAQKQALAAFQKLRAPSAGAANTPPALQSQESVTPQELGLEAQPQ